MIVGLYHAMVKSWQEHDMAPCIVVLYHMCCCILISFEWKETELNLFCIVTFCVKMRKNNLIKNILTVKSDSLPFALS